ncbi:MAG: glycine--tRNA ligase subunit beta [Kofleriaceae bacterium]
MASRTLLFEIGCEEVPAKMLARALAELPAQVTAALAAARLTHGEVKAMGAPRRLAIVVADLVEQQPDLSERVVGPPVGAAFGADGAPTKAAIGFAQKNGVDPGKLERGEVPGKKGEYAIAPRFVAGQATVALLPEVLATVAGGIAWPKSQRWGWGEATFVRPLQWLCALYGADVVPVTFGGLTAGRTTRGHRFLAPGPIELSSPAGYVEALRAGKVLVDVAERRVAVEAELARVAAGAGARMRRDDGLLDEVVNLVEYPVAILGSFDPAYLEVPAEIIVTAMRNHQRYFALEQPDGAPAPGFVALAGTIVGDQALVKQGFERAVTPRLSDARFFFTEDRKKPMEAWNERLASVVFQAKLGEHARTVGHKIERIRRAVRQLSHWLHCSVEEQASALAVAHLAKSDLASAAVGEFPELQGVMGMHYARLSSLGESEAFPSLMSQLGMRYSHLSQRRDTVALGISEHYLPKGSGGDLPTTVEGALVALADRMDTLLGCFATGQVPSGSADPYGLRRAAIGVLSILRGCDQLLPGSLRPEQYIRLHVDQLIAEAKSSFGDTLVVKAEHVSALRDFIKMRLRGQLVEEGIPSQDVDATLAKFVEDGVDLLDPRHVAERAQSLRLVPELARSAFKRMANILEEAESSGWDGAAIVDPGVFRRKWNVAYGRSSKGVERQSILRGASIDTRRPIYAPCRHVADDRVLLRQGRSDGDGS